MEWWVESQTSQKTFMLVAASMLILGVAVGFLVWRFGGKKYQHLWFTSILAGCALAMIVAVSMNAWAEGTQQNTNVTSVSNLSEVLSERYGGPILNVEGVAEELSSSTRGAGRPPQVSYSAYVGDEC